MNSFHDWEGWQEWGIFSVDYKVSLCSDLKKKVNGSDSCELYKYTKTHGILLSKRIDYSILITSQLKKKESHCGHLGKANDREKHNKEGSWLSST